MKTILIDKEITYDGSQLRSHWIYEQTSILGDAIASFIGPAKVPLKHMVDLADARQNAPIFSHLMLHFIVEHFDANLILAVTRQRLLAAIITEELGAQTTNKIVRKGDDIYVDGKKLSVSIATVSPTSSLIHFALNIRSDETPVPTYGLKDLKIDPKLLADKILVGYSAEISSMDDARCKVRSVL